jgi:sporulation protein YlmC with PRC-barrel domain
MLEVISALKNYAIEASDGKIGTVEDFLFDDKTWKIRWLVIDTGTWLIKRRVLLHPSSIVGSDYERESLKVNLTKAQVRESPDIGHDEPVSRQMENQLYNYYGWDPLWSGGYPWGGGLIGAHAGAIASPLSPPPYFSGSLRREGANEGNALHESGDPHLRSIDEVTGYHINATDGDIGHVENFIVDSATLDIRYLIIDTKNWWTGKHILMSPDAVDGINWSDHHVQLNVTQDQVKASPPWDPRDLMNQAAMKKLHAHYGWMAQGV